MSLSRGSGLQEEEWELTTSVRYDVLLLDNDEGFAQPTVLPRCTPLSLAAVGEGDASFLGADDGYTSADSSTVTAGGTSALATPSTYPSAAPSSKYPFYQAHLHLARLIAGAEYLRWPSAVSFIARAWPSVDAFVAWLQRAVDAHAPTDSAAPAPAPLKLRLTLSRAGHADVTFAPVPVLSALELRQALFPATLGTPDAVLRGGFGSARWRVVLDVQATSLIPSDSENARGEENEEKVRQKEKIHFFFKTTRRTAYDAAMARVKTQLQIHEHDQPQGHGQNQNQIDDQRGEENENENENEKEKEKKGIGALPLQPLLWNEQGQVTEGAYATVYLFRAGKWITPAATQFDASTTVVSAQAGTTRRWALERGLCSTGTVSKDDVRAGEVVWFSTGVRGFGWGVVEGLRQVEWPRKREM